MLRRLVPCALAALALLGVSVAPWLPNDLTPRAEARPDADPEPSTSQSKLLASEAAIVLSLRMGDFTGDDLMKTIFADLGEELSMRYGLPLTEVERSTVAMVRGGTVRIIQTKKAYDKDKLVKDLVKGPFGNV